MRVKAYIAGALVFCMLVGVACSTDDDDKGSSSEDSTAVPESIQEIMDQPRYKDATWSLLVTDVESGETFYSLNPDRMSFTGSTRKLFSVGTALDTLGADHREETPVYRMGEVGSDGALDGDLALVGAGDLTFGGRRIDTDTVEFTNFDHNDANNLGTANLTPQDPLYALDDLARQVRASGITSVNGDVVVDDRLFEPYRVPNGNLLITPVMLNENMVDTTVTPTDPGSPASVEYRPETRAFAVDNGVETTAAGTEDSVELSDDGLIECIGTAGCSGTVSGDIPADYVAPLSEEESFVGTFRAEEPNAFMRTAFIEALTRNGVTVTAPAVTENPSGLLPAEGDYTPDTRVANYVSAPYAQVAQLILKVSLNLGANLSLSLFGIEDGERTIDGALAAERKTLIDDFGINGDQFDFPTNGSGTPDSRAAPRALVDLLIAMHDTEVAEVYQDALPVLGVNGSLATSGTDLPAKGQVFAKTGTTIAPGEDGETIELKAQNLAGYIETKSGRLVAYTLMVNDAGAIEDIETDVSGVITDEARISSIIYENL
ncbi:MAG: D-alanyl-D-alanine carboxypeptidase [Actinomycetota bacterium]|nr:D-alanyl-D-alanine carboxypeptidase [Actinomycetota bacterium]